MAHIKQEPGVGTRRSFDHLFSFPEEVAAFNELAKADRLYTKEELEAEVARLNLAKGEGSHQFRVKVGKKNATIRCSNCKVFKVIFAPSDDGRYQHWKAVCKSHLRDCQH